MGTPTSWIRCSLVGAAAWLVLAALRPRPLADIDAIDGVLALHVLCLTPLLLALRPPSPSARWIWGAGAATASASVLLIGPARAALPVLWLAFAASLLGLAIRRFAPRRTEAEGLRAVAHLFLVVGAGWIHARNVTTPPAGVLPGDRLLDMA